jgi:tetratricopeptide (TPR) repeat protein
MITMMIVMACIHNSWLKRIPLLKSSEEGAWLYHEIGRGYWEMDKFEEAKEYGIKSLNLAHDSNDQHWQLNAEMLIAQTEVKLGELSGALSSFKNCLDIANIIGDTTTADGIKKAMEDVNTQIVSSLQQQTVKSDENDNESTSGTSTNN